MTFNMRITLRAMRGPWAIARRTFPAAVGVAAAWVLLSAALSLCRDRCCMLIIFGFPRRRRRALLAFNKW